MKKLLFSALIVCLTCFSSFAGDDDLFEFDYNSVQTEFTELNQLADLVSTNAGMTYSDLLLKNENLVTSMNLLPNSSLPAGASGEPVLGIPSFLWGCVFGVVGLVVVYIGTDEDKEQTKKALWGCVTGTVAYVAFYFIYTAVILDSAGLI